MKKGFSLLELLAVIIILAIIALITTPIILSSIEEAEDSTNVLSGEFYLKALDKALSTSLMDGNSIDDGIYSVMENGDVCLGELLDSNVCDNKILNVETTGVPPSSGKVSIQDGQIAYLDGILIDDYKISTDFNRKVIESDNRIICKVPDNLTTGLIRTKKGSYRSGDEYICEVKNGVSYRFFVLGENEFDSTKIDLILDRNINNDGTLTGKTVSSSQNGALYSTSYWSACETSCTNESGPLGAITFLKNATESWVNLPLIDETHTDIKYGEIQIVGRARLPKLSDAHKVGCKDYASKSCPLWMVNYTDTLNYTNKTTLEGMRGYWLIDSTSVYNAWFMRIDGALDIKAINGQEGIGIRPIITVSKSNIS